MERVPCPVDISIHAPLAGCDTPDHGWRFDKVSFQSTHPLRGATPAGFRPVSLDKYFNPRTPCGVRPSPSVHRPLCFLFQSTHPLRGATELCGIAPQVEIQISIHAPLAGCDRHIFSGCARNGRFQSTHPLRGATPPRSRGFPGYKNFNPRTPCGVRPSHRRDNALHGYFNPRTPCGVRLLVAYMVASYGISIHAPLAGCDCCAPRSPYAHHADFNPRTPCGVRQNRSSKRDREDCISIHAPLAGCDLLISRLTHNQKSIFQSTHPLRGATLPPLAALRPERISIHAPLAGCDVRCVRDGGVRRPISIHAPLAGCDRPYPSRPVNASQFQSTHPLRGATCTTRTTTKTRSFQSTHPLRGATAKTYKENCTFFELADKLSARIAAKKPSAKADRCA